MPAFHGKQLKARQERRVERVVVCAGDARATVEILLKRHVATEDLHSQEGENEEEKEQQQCQVDERVHGFDEHIHDYLHGLKGSQEFADADDPEYAEDPHASKALVRPLES